MRSRGGRRRATDADKSYHDRRGDQAGALHGEPPGVERPSTTRVRLRDPRTRHTTGREAQALRGIRSGSKLIESLDMAQTPQPSDHSAPAPREIRQPGWRGRWRSLTEAKVVARPGATALSLSSREAAEAGSPVPLPETHVGRGGVSAPRCRGLTLGLPFVCRASRRPAPRGDAPRSCRTMTTPCRADVPATIAAARVHGPRHAPVRVRWKPAWGARAGSAGRGCSHRRVR
jgi:hypothetical protein